jgi:receptor protein-tyrosine kinase
MSLIERAVSRTTNPSVPPAKGQEVIGGPANEEREDRIEQAIAKAVATEAVLEPPMTRSVRPDPDVVAEPRSRHAEAEAGGSAKPSAYGTIDDLAGSRDVDAGVGHHGELDLERLAALGMITPDADKTALAEEFRLIKRPLIANAMGRGASQVRHSNLIMVTSAVPGEGKTFCAINLAMSMAVERDYTVLLVDADVARPSVHVTLGMPRRAGLMDVLVGEKRLNEVIIPTNVEKLRILPAGKPHRHATELLASEAMAELLEDLATRYSDRIVVFDSPPLLATSEARALATQMGQVVVVVEAEQTTQQAVQEALREIESCEIVGLIYNKAKAGGDLYGYYNYGYGKYGQ